MERRGFDPRLSASMRVLEDARMSGNPRSVLWRRRLAGVFVMGNGEENRRQDAGATKTRPPS